MSSRRTVKIRVTVEAYTIVESDNTEATMTCEYNDLPTWEDIGQLVQACSEYADNMEFVEHEHQD